MTTEITPQPAVEIDMTRVSLVDNVFQNNIEQQQYPHQDDTEFERKFTVSMIGLQHAPDLCTYNRAFCSQRYNGSIFCVANARIVFLIIIIKEASVIREAGTSIAVGGVAKNKFCKGLYNIKWKVVKIPWNGEIIIQRLRNCALKVSVV